MPDENNAEVKVTKTRLKELLKTLVTAGAAEKFFGRPTSFEELDAIEAANKVANRIWFLGDAFYDMFIDIMYLWDNDFATPEEANNIKMDKLMDLIDGLSERVSSMKSELAPVVERAKSLQTPTPEQEPEQTGLDVLKNLLESIIPQTTSKSNVDVKELTDGITLIKDSDGNQYLYGRPTNNIYDREDEVLTTESHKEFMAYLDENPDEAPELWSWHVPDTARKNRAVWWDYADGFVHYIWPLTDQEAKAITNIAKIFTPGMSHGFEVLEKKGDAFLKYRTFEASLLPLEYAANLYTTYQVLTEESTMFTEEKRDFLTKLHNGNDSLLNALTESSESAKANADAANVKRKEEEGAIDPADDIEADEVDDTQPVVVEEAAEPIKALGGIVEVMQSTIAEGFVSLQKSIEQVAERVVALENRVEEEPETEPAPDTGKSLAAVVNGLNVFSGSIFDRAKSVDGRTVGDATTTDDTPEEIKSQLSAPEEVQDSDTNHILSGIMPKIKQNGVG